MFQGQTTRRPVLAPGPKSRKTLRTVRVVTPHGHSSLPPIRTGGANDYRKGCGGHSRQVSIRPEQMDRWRACIKPRRGLESADAAYPGWRASRLSLGFVIEPRWGSGGEAVLKSNRPPASSAGHLFERADAFDVGRVRADLEAGSALPLRASRPSSDPSCGPAAGCCRRYSRRFPSRRLRVPAS